MLALRGRLKAKLQNSITARKDFEDSYELLPNASAALRLARIRRTGEGLYQRRHLSRARSQLSDTATNLEPARDTEKLGMPGDWGMEAMPAWEISAEDH